ncbi:hypothetical protein DPMN_107391 [Dreissena polymorpha]|uniref:Uncharacterized protein n=1 Tax=Dreissena polymorpha TaxID=45954 RepID=A0A9D4QJR9_DREPO|nr:hypothetical protein DPMN_107391 [Dreissena polymorpha]
MAIHLFPFTIRCVLCEWPTYAENTTEVLDKLLTNYRKEIRPGLGGKLPTRRNEC